MMATIMDQTLAKMQAERHPTMVCEECRQLRPVAKVRKHMLAKLHRKIVERRSQMSTNDHEDLAYGNGFCGRQCHEANRGRLELLSDPETRAKCPECKKWIQSGEVMELNGVIAIQFCGDECRNGYDVRLVLGQKYVLVITDPKTSQLLPGSGAVFANGTLRGALIISEIINVPPLLVLDVLTKGVEFVRVGRLKGDTKKAEAYKVHRVQAGTGTIDGPCWVDGQAAIGPGGKEWPE